MPAGIWANAYGHPWSADLDHDGVLDVKQGAIHARVGGQYLCARLEGVREIRSDHPEWPSSTIPVLDALIIAHNAGESRLRTHPQIPTVTARFITTVHERVAAWSVDEAAGVACEREPDAPSVGSSAAPPSSSAAGCVPELGSARAVTVPAGTPHDVATAVANAMSYVGVTSGWHRLCDRLACRAAGYARSGYPTAVTHWRAMVAEGRAHPGDARPPLGSFVYWETGRPAGHVSVVVQADPRCDPADILVTSNGVYDSATGNHGGVYLLSFADLNAGYVRNGGYLGWSDPVCRGAILPVGTVHPIPAGA